MRVKFLSELIEVTIAAKFTWTITGNAFLEGNTAAIASVNAFRGFSGFEQFFVALNRAKKLL
jgi:hypothetical protein